MRILVIGGGGREHALIWKLAMSPKVEKIYCIPGNPGIARIAECIAADISDNQAICRFAIEQAIDLTVVGPELPLANGIVDAFVAHGLKIFGPTQAAAELEGSKAYAKQLMKKYGVPTADFAVFSQAEQAKEHVVKHGAPIVVKADGLAAGKGVVVAMTIDDALAAIDLIMCDQAFGQAGSRVVLEEFMTGEEASLLAFTDGYSVVPMVAAQDHKRIFDADQGPNTGGMGAYAPAPLVTPEILDQVMQQILQPVIDALRAEGRIYRGCLYAGLMITPGGPKVVEFNARFGDPETQVILPLLDADLAEIMLACVNGNLEAVDIKWKQAAAVCVVLASQGYPGSYRKGDAINGLEQAQNDGVWVFHAGTAAMNGKIITNGGRVLGVTALGQDIPSAVNKAYQAVGCLSFSGMHYRKDIACRAMERGKR